MKTDCLHKTTLFDVEHVSHDVRFVCLLPGLTDIVSELGQSAKIVGNSHECAKRGAILTASKLPFDGDINTSLSYEEISAGWKMIMSNETPLYADLSTLLSKLVCSFYDVDIEKLADTKPTVILSILPCSKSPLEPSREEIVEAIKRRVPSVQEVLSIDPSTLSEVYSAVQNIARVLKCPSAATMAVTKAKYQLRSIAKSMQSFPLPSKRKRIAIVQWANPIFLAGDWIPEIVEVGGGLSSSLTRPGGPSVLVTPHQLLDHDIIVFAICAVTLSDCQDACNRFLAKHSNFPFRRSRRVIATDATKLFSRPSLSAVVLSAEVVAEIVSNSNIYGHRGVVWSEL